MTNGRHGMWIAAVCIALGGCGSEATSEPTRASAPTPRPAVTTTIAAATPAIASTTGAIACPAALKSGVALPAGARLLGTAPAAGIMLSSATVTADAVGSIGDDLAELAEVEPSEGPDAPGMAVQLQDTEPSADQPFALVCRYGTPAPPLLAQAVLLMPLPANRAGYRCTTRLPQGKDPRAASSTCEPKR